MHSRDRTLRLTNLPGGVNWALFNEAGRLVYRSVSVALQLPVQPDQGEDKASDNTITGEVMRSSMHLSMRPLVAQGAGAPNARVPNDPIPPSVLEVISAEVDIDEVYPGAAIQEAGPVRPYNMLTLLACCAHTPLNKQALLRPTAPTWVTTKLLRFAA